VDEVTDLKDNIIHFGPSVEEIIYETI